MHRKLRTNRPRYSLFLYKSQNINVQCIYFVYGENQWNALASLQALSSNNCKQKTQIKKIDTFND